MYKKGDIMQYRPLGKTDLNVSLICLGTMTYGEQNSREDAFQQLDMALDHGVNFLDTAELYAVPPRAETQGKTEEYIGDYFAATGKRDRWIVATKVTAPSGPGSFPWIRGGDLDLTRANIQEAVDLSLKRLKTDYIDLYQIHWPDRHTNNFGQLGYTHTGEPEGTPILETLQALSECVQSGKIRHIGLSRKSMAWQGW
jgi:aryl-alcohol dehydrogenase-like predicted oxidoreductase